MGVVRGHDRDGIDAVVALALAGDELAHIAVTALRGEAQFHARLTRARRIGREDPAHDLPPAIVFGRTAMHASDPGFRSATEGRQTQRATEVSLQFRHEHDPSKRCACKARLRYFPS